MQFFAHRGWRPAGFFCLSTLQAALDAQIEPAMEPWTPDTTSTKFDTKTQNEYAALIRDKLRLDLAIQPRNAWPLIPLLVYLLIGGLFTFNTFFIGIAAITLVCLRTTIAAERNNDNTRIIAATTPFVMIAIAAAHVLWYGAWWQIILVAVTEYIFPVSFLQQYIETLRLHVASDPSGKLVQLIEDWKSWPLPGDMNKVYIAAAWLFLILINPAYGPSLTARLIFPFALIPLSVGIQSIGESDLLKKEE